MGDVVGNHLPVPGCRPGDMNEVLDDRFGNLLPHELGHQI